MLDAAQVGADVTSVARQPRQPIDASKIREQFLSDFDHWPHPYLLLDPAPGLVTVDVNAAYATATLTQRNDILGRSLFDVFPDNPDHPFADGVSNLNNSLKTVAKTGRPTPCPSSATTPGVRPETSWNATGNRSTRRSATPTDDSCSCCITSST
jgi:hypothetical protein